MLEAVSAGGISTVDSFIVVIMAFIVVIMVTDSVAISSWPVIHIGAICVQLQYSLWQHG